jgi:hypothetical protein
MPKVKELGVESKKCAFTGQSKITLGLLYEPNPIAVDPVL